MEKCFVIQPFDNDIYDQRYNEIFKPAIIKSGLEPYRVDEDNASTILIEDIESGIINSRICFAEITTDNPNVWYELGYSLACKKETVMVCSNERTGSYPFDIRHRSIITYKTNSKGDFQKLEENIENKIKAILQINKTTEKINLLPIKEIEGLQSNEMAILIIIMEELLTTQDYVLNWSIKEQMYKAGYTGIAFNIGLLELEKKGMIKVDKEDDYNGYEIIVCRLTDKGKNWILHNQDKFEFNIRQENQTSNNILDSTWDDVPF